MAQKKNKELLVFSIGDENHEPTQETLDKFYERVLRYMSNEKYEYMVAPYWVNVYVLGKTKIKTEKIEDFVKSEKFFCKDCKYLFWKEINPDCNPEAYCKYDNVTLTTYFQRVPLFVPCNKRNRKNDCPYFEQKKSFWKKHFG